MILSDVFSVLQWWFFIFILGIFFLPITNRLFSSFIDKGYAFSKIIGIIFLSYFTFLIGILHIMPFTRLSLILVVVFFAVLQIYRFRVTPFKELRSSKTFLVFEELLFLAGLFLWTFVRGYAPEIHGLEKYMDFGFINSILRAEYFPPKDMWLTPHSINYYYFGHLVTAVLTRLSGIQPQITYNLMLATILGLTLTASFSIGATLIGNIKKTTKTHIIKIIAAGILTGLLVTFAGNLHTIYTLFKPYENETPVPPISFYGNTCMKIEEIASGKRICVDNEYKPTFRFKSDLEFTGINPCYKKTSYIKIGNLGERQTYQCLEEEQKKISLFPNSYWYPNATRFIHNTIHEFPMYSWVVADLHGHVFGIPFVLLTIGFALSIFLRQQENKNKQDKKSSTTLSRLQSLMSSSVGSLRLGDLVFAGFLLSVMYMTNAWDGLIYLMLFIFLIIFILLRKPSEASLSSRIVNLFSIFLVASSVVFFTFVFFSLPFSIFFKPFASGIGILCAPDFLLKIKELGPFLFEQNHCLRSPWWQLLILYGFFYFFVLSFIVFLFKVRKVATSDLFVILLIIVATILILVPEFIYLKDIYPDHYRANTMFKLVFQAFIMLSLASGYIIVRIISSLGIMNRELRIKKIFFSALYLLVITGLLSLVFIYPFQATMSYYGNLVTYKGIDGAKYLKELYSDDYLAIQWLNKNIKGQPVILEAQGDSYTDYSRVSSNTGLPTVLGWTVHEWLWRGTYDVPAPRIAEIQTMYETEDVKTLGKLLKKYRVEYVFIGNLEREKYPSINENKFAELGRVVHKSGETKIYEIKK